MHTPSKSNGYSLISVSKSPTQIWIPESDVKNKSNMLDSLVPSQVKTEMKQDIFKKQASDEQKSKPIYVFSNQILEDIKVTVDEEARQTNK